MCGKPDPVRSIAAPIEGDAAPLHEPGEVQPDGPPPLVVHDLAPQPDIPDPVAHAGQPHDEQQPLVADAVLPPPPLPPPVLPPIYPQDPAAPPIPLLPGPIVPAHDVIPEDQRQYGCSKCRGLRKGCGVCRGWAAGGRRGYQSLATITGVFLGG